MIVYRDLISGDEMLSDAFKLVPVVDSDGELLSSILYRYLAPATFGNEDAILQLIYFINPL